MRCIRAAPQQVFSDSYSAEFFRWAINRLPARLTMMSSNIVLLDVATAMQRR